MNDLNTLRFAGIDIGSNAVRLLVNDVLPGKTYKDAFLKKSAYIRLPLRLGGDVFTINKIGKEKADNLVRAMFVYKELLHFYGVTIFRACATSATREAENSLEIIERVKKEAGFDIEVISGTQESMLLYETNKYNLPYGDTFLSADLGGGSLQVTLFQGDNLLWNHSFQIGTVRILNNAVEKSEFQLFETKLREISKKYPNLTLIGSGGNINKMSSIISNKTLVKSDFEHLHQLLDPLTIEERIRIHDLRFDRADVIVPAIEIYSKVLEYTGLEKIYVPKIGLADGIIRQLYEENHG